MTDIYSKKPIENNSLDISKYEKFKKDYRKNMEKGETVAKSLSTDPDLSLRSTGSHT